MRDFQSSFSFSRLWPIIVAIMAIFFLYACSGGGDSDPMVSDEDGDGYTVEQGDCNDADAGISPGATEVCGDGIDQDCSGADLACATDEEPLLETSQLSIALTGSLQNPAWSPDGKELLFTQFKNGYNFEPADLYVYNFETETLRLLVSDGSGNISLPGTVWNSNTEQIVFASTRDPHDEIYVIDDYGVPGEEVRITSREGFVAYEPSFSPDGQWVVFESHELDVEENGVVMKYKVDGSGDYIALTSITNDSRQPNWSPSGDVIVYQRFAGNQWDLWIVNSDGSNPHQITSGISDKTDVSFSPDGQWLVYSSDEAELEFATLFIIPVSGGVSLKVTEEYSGYAGAPSWSPDGTQIAFEASSGDPDDSTGTTLWLADVPPH